MSPSRAAVVCILLGLLAACGQAGPLVLPDEVDDTPPAEMPQPASLGDEEDAQKEEQP